jgi:cytochrome P450
MGTTEPQRDAVPRNRPDTPPGPPTPWWGLPTLRAMRDDYLGFTARLQRDHGDITFMKISRERVYDVFTPELVREVIVDHADDLLRWERAIEVFAQLFGQSVLVTEGATWQRQRRMLMPAFTPRRIADYAALMRDATATGLDAAVGTGEAEAIVDIDALFSRVAMDVILRTLFSSTASRDASNAVDAVRVLSDAAMREMFFPLTLPDWLPLPGKAAKRRSLRVLHDLVRRHIAARRAAGAQAPQDDLLARLLALRDEETGAALSDAEVFDQCMVTFQAGHETTATALTWWSRLLADHPQAAQRAQAEVDTVLAGRAPGPDDITSLPWLSATLKEAMRLYPPVPALITRRARREMTIGGWVIPRRAVIRLTLWFLHRDPRSFDYPDEFRPARFLPDAPAPPRGAYLPFGAGPRVCIGQHFAMLEMTLIAAMLLQRYRLAVPAGEAACVPVVNVTLRARDGIRLRLLRRADRVSSR